MSNYRVAVNFEWSSKCNARCAMCPRTMIENPQLMTDETFYKALDRINPKDVFRTVLAGYGEPTTHPRFMEYVSAVGEHPVRFDLVTNGELLDEEKIRHLDGKIGLLILSFSSIDRAVYESVHVGLDHERVKENIVLAQKTFKKTPFAISLTPLAECIETLPETIEWLKGQGVELLTMSPTLYNRAGTMEEHHQATEKLRGVIKRYKLLSQELDFIPSVMDIFLQTWNNRFRCMPRNTDLFITAGGDYMFCYNDITHKNTLGSINDLSMREALKKREKSDPIPEICDGCNMHNRYRFKEIAGVFGKYVKERMMG
ncbi:MAG: radical SAM protein [Proteobacteria bacterium]|nr:radical SAM protein [Pseudomonadota bacterium]